MVSLPHLRFIDYDVMSPGFAVTIARDFQNGCLFLYLRQIIIHSLLVKP